MAATDSRNSKSGVRGERQRTERKPGSVGEERPLRRTGRRLIAGITLYWVGLSAATDGVTTLIIPTQVDAATSGSGRATALGLITVPALLLAALIQPIAGAGSDRFRSVMGRRGWIGVGTGLALISLVLLAASTTLPTIAIAFGFVVVALSIAQAGLQGFIPDLVDTSHRGVASGWKGFADVGGAAIGFLALGGLLERFGVSVAVLIVGLLLAVSFLLVFALVREPNPRPKAAETNVSILRGVYRLDRVADDVLLRLIGSRFVFLLAVFAVGRFFVFFVDERIGMGPATAGGVLGVLALITMSASPLTGWAADRVGRFRVMRTGAVLGAIGIAVMIPAQSVLHLLVAGAILGLGSASFSSANWAATADQAAGHEAGRRMALSNLGTGGAVAAAGLFGLLVDAVERIAPGLGYTVAFGVASSAALVSALFIRRLDEPEGPLQIQRSSRSGPENSSNHGG